MGYFSRGEWALWMVSVLMIVGSFLLFPSGNVLSLAASLVGVTSLIYNAKGNPIGQGLMIVFSVLYGMISYSFRYYGEMITYLGMTMPMAAIAMISWLKNPYQGRKAEVAVGNMGGKEWAQGAGMTLLVTAGFYFILRFFHTPHLLLATLSIATSFLAAYLTYKRSPWFALGYASNDVVLMVLWVLAAKVDRGCISVVVCFAAFLLNDLYGFLSWRKMEQKQAKGI